jgi:hypothetical protein
MREGLRIAFESDSRPTSHLKPIPLSNIAKGELDAVVAMLTISAEWCCTRVKKDTHWSFTVSCGRCGRESGFPVSNSGEKKNPTIIRWMTLPRCV